MKILFVTTLYPLKGAGLDSATVALKEFLDEWRKTDEVAIVRPVFNQLRLPACDDPVVHVIRGFRIPAWEQFFVDIPALTRSLSFRPDIVVAHMFKSFFWAWRIAEHFGAPFVAGVHFSDIRFLRFPYLKARFRRVFADAAGLACRSRAMRDQLLARFPALAHKAFCTNSGIDPGHIRPLQFCLEKAQRWRSSGHVRFATAGRLIKRKNIDVTLRALYELASDLSWDFTIIGDGPERRRLEGLAKRLGISDRVAFVGWLPRERVLEELLRSDVFVLVSAPETFGLVYLEAMAAGNIVIGAKAWGVDGFITDNVSGYLCSPRDPEDLSRRIRRIAIQSSSTEINSLLESSHTLIRESTTSSAASAYRAHLAALCGQTPSPGRSPRVSATTGC